MEVTGILHCHSTYSYDAKLSLSELRDECIARGVQFVCMTEHVDELIPERAEAFVRECETLSDDRFRFIPGFEVPYRSAHVLMIGCRSFYKNYAPTMVELIPWVEAASFVVLAHPVRNDFMVDDGLLASLDALEVWNQQYEGKRVPRVRSLRLLEALRKRKDVLWGTGGVDLHRTEHFGSPYTTLDVHELTEAAILEKLTAGAFVVSSAQSTFFGTLPNTEELIQKHRFESALSISIIVLGKFVNKTLAAMGLSFPKSLKQLVRKRL
jgi:predicted metal-dependent phosphoesterase TrpH